MDESDQSEVREPVTVQGAGNPGANADLDTLRAWMREQGVSAISVAFNGYGDEGSVYPEDSKPEDAFERSILGLPVEEFIRGLTYDLLSTFYDGWQDNDGSGGAVEFTPDGARIRFGWRELVSQPDLVLSPPDDPAKEDGPGL